MGDAIGGRNKGQRHEGYSGGNYGLCRGDRTALAWQLQKLSCESSRLLRFWKGCMSYFITNDRRQNGKQRVMNSAENGKGKRRFVQLLIAIVKLPCLARIRDCSTSAELRYHGLGARAGLFFD